MSQFGIIPFPHVLKSLKEKLEKDVGIEITEITASQVTFSLSDNLKKKSGDEEWESIKLKVQTIIKEMF